MRVATRRVLGGACGAALLLAGGAASADEFYASLMGGASWLGEVSDNSPNFGTADIDFGTGYFGAAAFGYAFMSGLRAEGEFSVRGHDVNSFTIGAEGVDGGNARIFALMANGWYDFNRAGQIRPFVGGGVGFANTSLEVNESGSPDGDIDDDDFVFAYQLGVGVAYHMTPNVALTGAYRYFGTTDADFEANNPDFGVTEDYSSHNVLFGVQIGFGAPPPP